MVLQVSSADQQHFTAEHPLLGMEFSEASKVPFPGLPLHPQSQLALPSLGKGCPGAPLARSSPLQPRSDPAWTLPRGRRPGLSSRCTGGLAAPQTQDAALTTASCSLAASPVLSSASLSGVGSVSGRDLARSPPFPLPTPPRFSGIGFHPPLRPLFHASSSLSTSFPEPFSKPNQPPPPRLLRVCPPPVSKKLNVLQGSQTLIACQGPVSPCPGGPRPRSGLVCFPFPPGSAPPSGASVTQTGSPSGLDKHCFLFSVFSSYSLQLKTPSGVSLILRH
ncbi:PREDICTED: vegetative cell wall protein gp1-like [Chinchilla lanigera]|uniref:vegetative cell wall protein gp1-like n=1 Tax=Chinchilla lanigera TaxID=34839 RepID=UPI00038EB40F|nr:PREDICTED: vegetative cell wall protein gp1-like [Chinchilla lanigera]XP_013366045.1 PREDICTED: vegetative cell wall protein gp1-like [Chinchilla lanigera]